MDFNLEKIAREESKNEAESHEAKLREMDNNIDLFQSLGYDKLYQAKFEMYQYIVDTLRIACSEMAELKAKIGMGPRDKKLYQLLREQHASLSTQEFKLRVFFQNVKSFPSTEPEESE